MAEWGTGSYGRNELTLVSPAGGSLKLPINPESIVWRTTVGTNIHQVYRGRHFQATKVYRTGGTLVINTGSDRPKEGIVGGKRLKDKIAAFIAAWMSSAVYQDSGPITMIMSSQGINMKVWFVNGPEEGVVAATTNYKITLNFEILDDLATPQDMSSVTGSTMGFIYNTASNIITHTTKSGDTVEKIAAAYHMEGYENVITNIMQNAGAFKSDGTIVPGISLAIPSMSALRQNTYAEAEDESIIGPATGDVINLVPFGVVDELNENANLLGKWVDPRYKFNAVFLQE